MAIYNIDKIKDWYDDFNGCKTKYLNNYYQQYKSSYVVTNSDNVTKIMQRKLDTYYSRIKKAYNNIGTQWKNLYNDLINADAALAGTKSAGSVNSSSAAGKISSMPKLVEYKGNTNLINISSTTVGVVTGATYASQSVQNSAITSAASNTQAGAQAVSQSAQQTTDASSGGLGKTLGMAAAGAATGAAIASVIPGIGTVAGAVVGGIVGAVIGSGVISKIVKAIQEGSKKVKEQVNGAVSEVKNANTVSEKLKAVGKGVLNVGEKVVATGATVATSAVEGVLKLGEDAVDLVALVGTGIASIGTGALDLGNYVASKITGDKSSKSTYTKQMWEKSRAFVSKDLVGNMFDGFYANTSAGQWIKNNALAFDTTRAITKEVSEVAGVVALSAVTGGSAAVIYGAAKTAEHTEKNWQDQNTSTSKGLFKGVLQGTLDGVFFEIGVKGDAAAKGAAEGAAKATLEKAGVEVTEKMSREAIKDALKTVSKQEIKALDKTLTKTLSKKMAFECSTAVAQDFGTIGVDAVFSNNTVTDSNGNTIHLNNLSDKINFYYNEAGGASGLAQSAITAGLLSGLSDRVDTKGLVKEAKKASKQATKEARKEALKSVASTTKEKIVNSKIAQKASSSASATKSKIHSANLRTTYKLQQLKASTNVKLTKAKITAASTVMTKGLELKNKVINSKIAQKASSSASAAKSKIHSANLRTTYKLQQLKANTNVKLTKAKITAASDITAKGLKLKEITLNAKNKFKNIDISAKTRKAKNVVSGITGNTVGLFKNKIENVNLKFKNNLNNAKYKLSSDIKNIGEKTTNLKSKLKRNKVKTTIDNVDTIENISSLRNEYNDLLKLTKEDWFINAKEAGDNGWAWDLNQVDKVDKTLKRMSEIKQKLDNPEVRTKINIQDKVKNIETRINSNSGLSVNDTLNKDLETYRKVLERLSKKSDSSKLAMNYALNGDSSYVMKKIGSISDDNKFIILQMEKNPNLIYNGKTKVNFGSAQQTLDMHQLYDTKNKININVQSNYSSINNEYGLTQNDVIEALEKISNKNSDMVERIHTVNITDIRNPDDSYWSVVNKTVDFQSAATGGGGEINVYKYSSSDQIENTLAHEMGHCMDIYNNTSFGVSNSKAWENAVIMDGNVGITSYAENSRIRPTDKYAEDFADSIAILYKNGGDYFSKRYPNRAKLLKWLYPSLF